MPEIHPSLPPKEKASLSKASLIAHTIIDAMAIIVMTIFVMFDKIDAGVGVGIICLIAGVWLNSNINGKNPPQIGSGPSAIIGALSGIAKLFVIGGRA